MTVYALVVGITLLASVVLFLAFFGAYVVDAEREDGVSEAVEGTIFLWAVSAVGIVLVVFGLVVGL